MGDVLIETPNDVLPLSPPAPAARSQLSHDDAVSLIDGAFARIFKNGGICAGFGHDHGVDNRGRASDASELTYGEIRYPGMQRLCSQIQLLPTDIVYDIGAGTNRFVQYGERCTA